MLTGRSKTKPAGQCQQKRTEERTTEDALARGDARATGNLSQRGLLGTGEWPKRPNAEGTEQNVSRVSKSEL